MKRIMWIGIIIFGLVLIGVSALMPQGEAATPHIFFENKATLVFPTTYRYACIHVENISFIDNMTEEIYQDDLTTPRTIETRLQSRALWASQVGTWYTMQYPLSPMDTGAFNRTQFFFYIDSITGTLTSVIFQFEITLLNNQSTFNRNITVTGAGNYQILNGLEMCTSCVRYRCMSYGASGNLRIRVNQSRFGVIAKCSPSSYLIKDASIYCYNYYGAMGKRITLYDDITFNLSSNFYDWIFEVAGQNDVSMNDLSFRVYTVNDLYAVSKWFFADGRYINISSCSFYSNKTNVFNMAFSSILKINNSLFDGISIVGGNYSDVNDNMFVNLGNTFNKNYFKFHSGNGFNNNIIKNGRYGITLLTLLGGFNVSNIQFKDVDYELWPSSSTQTVHLINCTSNTGWQSESMALFPYTTGVTYRDYTFKLRTMYDGSPLSNVNVKIYDNYGSLEYSGLTDSNGFIPKIILNHCLWNVSYPYVPKYYSPYTINLTKSGFQSIQYNFSNDVELNFTIGLLRNVSCPITPITLYENIANVTGTHEYRLNGSGYHVYANYTGNTTPVFLFQSFINATGTHVKLLRLPGWYVWANVTGNTSTAPGTGNSTVMLNFTGLQGFIDWTGDYTVNTTNISFLVTTNMSLNGSVQVNEDAYFLSGMLSLDPAAMILSLFFGFFYIGYKSDKRSGGWFMLFAGFLLIALGILIYGSLGYAAALVTPFAIFIMALGVKKGLYGPETTGEEKAVSSKKTK